MLTALISIIVLAILALLVVTGVMEFIGHLVEYLKW